VRLLAVALLALRFVHATTLEDAAFAIVQKIGRVTEGKPVTVQAAPPLRPVVEAALRKAGMVLAPEGLPILFEKTDTAADCILAGRVQASERVEIFAESCLPATAGDIMLHATPLMTHHEPVLDLKKTSDGWLLLERDQISFLPDLRPETVPTWSKPVEAPVRRHLRGRIVSTDPLEVRFDRLPATTVKGCAGERLTLDATSPEDGRIVIAVPGVKPLRMDGFLVALNPADDKDALLTLMGTDGSSYEVWNISVACVR
jgi:hypothetical protein